MLVKFYVFNNNFIPEIPITKIIPAPSTDEKIGQFGIVLKTSRIGCENVNVAVGSGIGAVENAVVKKNFKTLKKYVIGVSKERKIFLMLDPNQPSNIKTSLIL